MRIKETCSCGASVDVNDLGTIDPRGYEPASRIVNVWRKYHRHSKEQDTVPPAVGGDLRWEADIEGSADPAPGPPGSEDRGSEA